MNNSLNQKQSIGFFVCVFFYLSVLCLSLLRNFSLSSSTIFKIPSINCFLSCNPRLVTSISPWTILPFSRTCLIIPFLSRSYVGRRSIEAHRSSSSSSCLSLRLNTLSFAFHASRMLADAIQLRRLLDVKLCRPLTDLARSSAIMPLMLTRSVPTS